MARKKAYVPKKWETEKTKDRSVVIYQSMMESPAYKDLSPRQRQLYTYAKSRYYGQTTASKEALFQQFDGLATPENIGEYFSLTKGNVTLDWDMYSKGNLKEFYKDLEALILHGFIRVKASDVVHRKKTIYQYSEKWRLFGTEEFEISPAEMTCAMKKKYKGGYPQKES